MRVRGEGVLDTKGGRGEKMVYIEGKFASGRGKNIIKEDIAIISRRKGEKKDNIEIEEYRMTIIETGKKSNESESKKVEEEEEKGHY